MINKNKSNFMKACFGEIVVDEKTAKEYSWFHSTTCRYCNTEVSRNDADVAYSYWLIMGTTSAWFICHIMCKTAGYAAEAYECQCLDANCNDCFFLDREQLSCKNTGEPTRPVPNMPGLMPCFKHRKDANA